MPLAAIKLNSSLLIRPSTLVSLYTTYRFRGGFFLPFSGVFLLLCFVLLFCRCPGWPCTISAAVLSHVRGTHCQSSPTGRASHEMHEALPERATPFFSLLIPVKGGGLFHNSPSVVHYTDTKKMEEKFAGDKYDEKRTTMRLLWKAGGLAARVGTKKVGARYTTVACVQKTGERNLV